MTYTPTKWVNGGKPAISAENLNKIEEALARLSIQDITTTDSTTQPNSYAGRENILEIGGVTEQDSTAGNQLFKFADGLNILSTGVTGEDNGDGTFSLKGTSTASAGLFVLGNEYFGSNAVFTLKAGTYYVSGIPSNVGFFLYKTGSEVSPVTVYAPGGSFTLAEDTDFSSISLRWANNMTFNESAVKIMLNVGTAALPWEPFTNGPAPNPSYPMEIKKSVVSGVKTHHKNFLDCRGLTKQTFNGMTFDAVYDINGNLQYVEVNGTATSGTEYNIADLSVLSGIDTTDCIISGCPSGGSYTTYSLAYLEWDSSWTSLVAKYDYGNGASLSRDKNMSIAQVRIIIVKGYTATNLRFYPMIRKADIEDATYEPYTESSYTFSQPIELYGIGDVQDVIKDGKIKRRFTKAVFDGTEGWVRQATRQFYLPLDTLVKKGLSDYYNSILCDRYKVIPSHAQTLIEGICGYYDSSNNYPNSNWLYIIKPNIDTREDFIASLQANPITVVYELATPTTEALPIADQIGLNSLQTYDGITYVEFDAEIQPTFKAEYGTSKVGGYTLESLLTARNNELRG